MLKKEITYTNLDGEKETGTFYFNLTRAELLEMAMDEREGKDISTYLNNVIKAQNNKQLMAEFKNIILMAYGKRDGDEFVKSEEISNRFTQHPAYDELFWELTTVDNAFANFVNALIPANILAEIDKLAEQGEKGNEIMQKIVAGAVPVEDAPPAPPFTLPPPAPTSGF